MLHELLTSYVNDRAKELANQYAIVGSEKLAAFMATLDTAIGDFGQQEGVRINCFPGWKTRVHVYIYCTTLSFKEGPLAEMLGRLAELPGQAGDPTQEDMPASTQRVFEFNWPEGMVKVYAEVDEANPEAGCHRVQVGTRIEEVPVYEMRCND